MPEVVLQHVVLPWGVELPAPMAEVLPLYVAGQGVTRPIHGVDPGTWTLTLPGDGPPEEVDPDTRATIRPAADTRDLFRVTGRRQLHVLPFGRASFDTYFNRVHAGYYARWTGIEALTLRVHGQGRARVTVRHSTREGRQVIDAVDLVDLGPDAPHRVSVPAATFAGGGCLWFEVEALDEGVDLTGADWVAEAAASPEPVVDVAICTFNRPADVRKALRTLRADEEFLAHLGTVWVVDHGTQHLHDLPGAEAESVVWGDQLQVIEQPNLGGSGGFSRGMHESARRGRADYVFLMDDDALAEPESLRRAVVFAELAERPLAVGGQMLLRGKPIELHSSGERVDGRTFRWGPAPLGRESIRLDQEPLDAVVDVGYNGWWLCLIPTGVIRELGLAQPFFIKWDDAEYGMRMAQAGYLTVTLPGVATWHESWELKDDTTDWTLYFHIRNRLVAAAMLSAELPREVAERRFQAIVRDILRRDVIRNVTRRAFSSIDAANQAMEDFLAGPGILERPLDELVAEVRANRGRWPGDEAVEALTAQARPPGDPARRRKLSLAFPRALAREYGLDLPLVPLPLPPGLIRRRPVSDEWDIWREPVDRGPVPLPKAGDAWWGLTDHPDAAVVSVDGSRAYRRTRNPEAARQLTRRAAQLARRVLKEGPDLVGPYGRARRQMALPAAWERQWNR
ncbi:MAG: glycosyltransferase [Candidatus Nanopelagicales bacterium]|nr:glycosyltransferase [Candidatus Nanopelagicales bacterium]